MDLVSRVQPPSTIIHLRLASISLTLEYTARHRPYTHSTSDKDGTAETRRRGAALCSPSPYVEKHIGPTCAQPSTSHRGFIKTGAAASIARSEHSSSPDTYVDFSTLRIAIYLIDVLRSDNAPRQTDYRFVRLHRDLGNANTIRIARQPDPLQWRVRNDVQTRTTSISCDGRPFTRSPFRYTQVRQTIKGRRIQRGTGRCDDEGAERCD